MKQSKVEIKQSFIGFKYRDDYKINTEGDPLNLMSAE